MLDRACCESVDSSKGQLSVYSEAFHGYLRVSTSHSPETFLVIVVGDIFVKQIWIQIVSFEYLFNFRNELFLVQFERLVAS
jgi:hypothetical protein